MPVIVTGTVVRWEVVNAGKPNERVKHKSDMVVTVYITDDDDDAVVSIISKYILDEVAKKQDPIELLELARDGLLRVVGITRATVTPPSAP
jgi:hypothetical protein